MSPSPLADAVEVKVLLFAAPREAAGRREVRVRVADRATARDVLDALVLLHPELARWRGTAAIAVNRRVAAEGAPVSAGDEVALLPPVSGGSSGVSRPARRADLTDRPLDVAAALAAADHTGAGAAVCFLGLVRSPAAEGPVERLEFEAYEAMARAELADVAARACAKFGLVDARIVHRVGTVAAGEPVVLVVVTAAHRTEAFGAAAWIMDELKTVVPIWKKEIGPWGGRWVKDSSAGEHARSGL